MTYLCFSFTPHVGVESVTTFNSENKDTCGPYSYVTGLQRIRRLIYSTIDQPCLSHKVTLPVLIVARLLNYIYMLSSVNFGSKRLT